MALFQPTNIIPSSFTDGVVDTNDAAQISWQVNGNSAMTAFEIEFSQNDDNSTPLTGANTGKILVSGGFYGTDRFGQPKIFTWTAGKKWNEYNSAFTNGNQYKFKIRQYWQEGGSEKYIDQIESSVFITRNHPTLSMQRSIYDNFAGATQFLAGSELPASIGYFVGSYNQIQGAPVREVRWQVATWNGAVGEILADTGYVDTPTLQYSFDGFFIGDSYAVRCSGKADYQTYGTQDFDSGWVNFTAKIPDGQKQSEYTGNFTVQCLPKESAILLQWDGIEVIPPSLTPATFSPVTVNGSVTLPQKQADIEYSIAWKKQSDNDMNFVAPWAVAVKFNPPHIVNKIEKRIEGVASTISSNTDFLLDYAPTEAVRKVGNNYLSRFKITPTSPYAKCTLTDPVYINLYPSDVGHEIISTSVQNNNDGSIIVSVISNFSPTSADFLVTYYSYSYSETFELDADIVGYDSVKFTNSNVLQTSIRYNRRQIDVTIYSKYSDSAVLNVAITFNVSVQEFLPQEKLLELGGSDLQLGLSKNQILLTQGKTQQWTLEVPTTASSYVAIIMSNMLQAVCYDSIYLDGDIVLSTPISYGANDPITSVAIFGGDSGMTFSCVSIYKGNGSEILQLYNHNSDFEPIWNSEVYSLYMTANFNGNLEGGTGTSSGNGFRIYRQEVGGKILTPIANVGSNVTALKDYGIRSRKAYVYSLYAYDSNQVFMVSVQNDTIVSTCFKSYSLLVCDYDTAKDTYHVRKQYLFALNLSAGSVGNNNTPTLNANFTSYPTRMPSTQNYASGTLQGLIGAIYTVPALIEQIGGFRHTAKPSTLDYFDSVDLEKELYDLSTAPYQLFLRDMEGHLRMISTNNQISMTPDLKKRQIPKTISFPWVEIGDASDVTIIQTPDDYGWNNDEQVLDVHLDVDPETGILTANYPKPYTGTKFYLTGANKEILDAKTPIGVAPAQFSLSEAAEEVDDGKLNATAKVNTEEGD